AANEMQSAAPAMGIQLEFVDIRSTADLDIAFSSQVFDRAQALVISAAALLQPVRARVAELALQHRLPAINLDRSYVQAGLLMSYGANTAAYYRRAATYVDKILTGAKPADLPVELPTLFDL